MINRQALLADLQKFLQRIEADLLERSESTEVPEVPAALHTEYEKASNAERTAQNYEDWRTDTITQAAAAWVLSCVFVRFLEDNSLIDPPKIAGPGERLARARDEHELYFRSHPQHTDREYLLSIFAELAKLPGTKDIFGEHNAINDFPNWLSGDAAGELLNFFQKIDASTGSLVHDFTDPNWDTRFLGDLYQDLSEDARKKFALLQTPDFVEEFILDRTLDPAIEEFGLVPQLSATDQHSPTRFKMIDPACGSGHFLLGAFPRLLERWQRKEPGTNIRELTQRAIDSIHGVDINPFAVAIARFRLLLVAMKACNIRRLDDAPAFRINVACGDSLLHGENRTTTGQKLWDFAEGATDEDMYTHTYPGENLQIVRDILKPGTFHCVVANPPYIVPNDRKLNDWYRKRFSACHMKYSLSVPFLQQIFQLALHGGYTGQITSNSFMKRDFGSKLVESHLVQLDLTHLIDCSGVYLPGHGTSTVIIFGRSRAPISGKVRTVMGIEGVAEIPLIASEGEVWKSITSYIDRSSFQDKRITVADTPRSQFTRHPWSLSGGGAAELKNWLDETFSVRLGQIADAIGIHGMTNADEAFFAPKHVFDSRNIKNNIRSIINGDQVVDWLYFSTDSAIFPYADDGNVIPLNATLERHLWPYRTELGSRATFSKGTYFSEGLPWWKWHQIAYDRLGLDTIAFAEIGTHNRFVLDTAGQLFSRSANIVVIKDNYDLDAKVSLLGTLNSSLANFWGRQVWQPKGGDQVGNDGARVSSVAWEDRLQRNSSKLKQFPLPDAWDQSESSYSAKLFELLKERKKCLDDIKHCGTDALESLTKKWKSIERSSIYLQEELDWENYYVYGIAKEKLCFKHVDFALCLGQRAFEIVLAQKNAAGEVLTTWFERHSSKPITDLPTDWPEDYKKLVEQRIKLIESDPHIRLIEQPENKRRWNTEPWESQVERALCERLLLRLETYFDFDGRMSEDLQSDKSTEVLSKTALSPCHFETLALYSVSQLADAARRDPQFIEVGEIYRDDPAFDVQALVEELVLAESVPHLPILRYKDSGLRKRVEWEKTWDLQRREDDIDAELKSAQESLKLAEQCVRDRFKSELEELGKMRARLLEATTQAYIDLGKEAPLYEPQYEAEVHASVLLNHIGVKKMTTAIALNSAKDAVFKYQLDLDHKIRLACDEDITVLKCHNRLRAIPDKPDIPVPPKYTSADFISTGGARYWSLRGKLDVPKERWISFPHCEGPDGSLVICWAGYDHLQQAQAISAYYVRVQTEFGGSDDPRLLPLLASLIELLPWLAQWHNEPNANFDGLRMGDYFEGFVNEEARNLGKTLAEIKAWTPPMRTATRSRKKAK